LTGIRRDQIEEYDEYVFAKEFEAVDSGKMPPMEPAFPRRIQPCYFWANTMVIHGFEEERHSME